MESQYIDASFSGTTDGRKTQRCSHKVFIIPPVMSHLTLWGYLGWLLSQQRWSRSLYTQFQTATLQTGTAESKTQSTIKTLSCLPQTAFILCHLDRDRWLQGKRQKLESHLEHCSGSYTLSEMQQSVSVQTTWRVHLTDQCWGILKCEEGSRCNLSTQKGSNVNINDKVVVLCDYSCLTLSLL